MGRKSVQILLVEEDPDLREKIKGAIAGESDFMLVGDVNDGLEARKRVEAGLGSLLVTSSMKVLAECGEMNPRLKMILVAERPASLQVCQVVNMGVSGYVIFDGEGETLCRAIRYVAAGEAYVDPRVTASFFNEMRRMSSLHPLQIRVEEKEGFLLTRREREVLRLMAEGKSNRAISEDLFISEKTAKNHVSSILQKLNVEDRTHAVVLSIKKGWLRI